MLIPARNEERNLPRCLDSLLAQRVPPREILVLDDRSGDATARIAERAAGRPGSRVRLLRGRELPDGWMGKSHACAQLAAEASGRWLLFLDADVALEPGALEAAAREASSQGSGLVSGFPRQETGTWMEKLVVPMMLFTILCHLPLRLVSRSRSPRFAAANGAFILIASDSYRRIGGHAAVRSSLLDDMELIRLAKRGGEPARLARIDGFASSRMYRSAAEVWAGYRKNLFPGLGRSLPLLLFVSAAYAALYLLPAAGVLAGLAAWAAAGHPPAWLPAAAAAWALGALVKLAVDRSGRAPAWQCLLLPASIALVLLIGADSARCHYRKRGYEWKGRRYA
ncbi:glycosyltransferase [Paenibacillus albicereus]|uniref:4,4'-diaponeurosporenoate glycosyltransferase n=1 Tax=Paenibacillus albicereus TaxID=2726185 RepID=A0A6H2H2S3_9BACL|nr:glycosyltransferase [Paenibacillus albicereus]